MARMAAAAALLCFLLSVLAVAHCRVIEAEPATDAVAEEAAEPTEVVVPTHSAAAGEGFLRLPSHRRPCRHGHGHGHFRLQPWGERHHGFLLHGMHRLQHNPVHGGAYLPAVHDEERKDVEEEVKAVAEPDPDRSLPDTDGEGVEEEAKKPIQREEEEDEMVKAWRREMQRRFFRHSRRFHHRHHLRHHGEDEEDEDEDEHEHEKEDRFHHRHHHDHEEDEDEHEHKQEEEHEDHRFHHRHHHDEEEKARKRFRRDGHDSDVDEEEEMARRWRKAAMRMRDPFHHRGHRFHHRRHHHEAEAQEEEEGGMMKWFKDLIRF